MQHMFSQFTNLRKYDSMRRLLFLALIAIALISCSKEVSDSQKNNFIKYFGGGAGSKGFFAHQTDHGYFAVGYNTLSGLKKQVYVVNTNLAGNTLWERSFGNETNEEARVLRILNSNLLVLGTSQNDLTGTISSFLLAVGTNGDSLSTIAIGDGSFSVIVNDFVEANNELYLAGESYQNSSVEPDYFVAKYSVTGEKVWERVFDYNGVQRFFKIFIKPNGNLILCGTNNAVIGSNVTHVAVAELSNQGLPIRFYNAESTSNQDLSFAYLMGNSLFFSYNQQSTNKAYLAKIDLNSYSMEWILESGIAMESKSFVVSPNGMVTLCGEINGGLAISQISANGEIVNLLGNTSVFDGNAEMILSTSDNGFLVVGSTAPDYGAMMQLIKMDSELFLFKP